MPPSRLEQDVKVFEQMLRNPAAHHIERLAEAHHELVRRAYRRGVADSAKVLQALQVTDLTPEETRRLLAQELAALLDK